MFLVKVVGQAKLLPVSEETVALASTLQTINQAADWLSELAFNRDVKIRQGCSVSPTGN